MFTLILLVLLVLFIGFSVLTFIKNRLDIYKIQYQNNLLQALRHLDDAALSITDIDSLSQNIVDAIHKELGYFFGVIALADEKAGGIRRIAISNNFNITSELQKLPSPYNVYKNQVVPFNQTNNLLVKAFTLKKYLHTDSLFDLQIGIFPEEISQTLQKNLSMKEFYIYPLITRGRVYGIIYYCITQDKEKLSKFEFDVMDAYTREVSRVLDNALLYQDVKSKSEQLVEANQKLKELDKLKDDFVSIASHELRTPMTAIRSYAWMALNRSDILLSEKMKKYLSRTLLSTERLINLVNDMLNISRIESGRIEITPKVFDINQLVQDIIMEVEVKAKEKNLRLQVIPTAIPQVFADPDKVHQVLLNLLGNAMKFTPAYGVVTVSFLSDGQMLDISVKDSGVGISKDDISRLFKKFGRLDNSYVAAATSGGTGLGLYISKSLVEIMGGKIWVNSEGVGKGTTFTFSIPVASQSVLANAQKYTKKVQGEIKELEPVRV